MRKPTLLNPHLMTYEYCRLPRSYCQPLSLSDMGLAPASFEVSRGVLLAWGTAVFRAKIPRVYWLDSVKSLLSRGEITWHTGNSPGDSTRIILVRRIIVWPMAASMAAHLHWPAMEHVMPHGAARECDTCGHASRGVYSPTAVLLMMS